MSSTALNRLRSGSACITFATGDRNPSLDALRLRGTDVVRALADIIHQDRPGLVGMPSARAASRFAAPLSHWCRAVE